MPLLLSLFQYRISTQAGLLISFFHIQTLQPSNSTSFNCSLENTDKYSEIAQHCLATQKEVEKLASKLQMLQQMPNNNIGLTLVFKRFKYMTLEQQKSFVSTNGHGFVRLTLCAHIVLELVPRVLSLFLECHLAAEADVRSATVSRWLHRVVDAVEEEYYRAEQPALWRAQNHEEDRLHLSDRVHFRTLLHSLQNSCEGG